jgi:hypothetical protein
MLSAAELLALCATEPAEEASSVPLALLLRVAALAAAYRRARKGSLERPALPVCSRAATELRAAAALLGVG